MKPKPLWPAVLSGFICALAGLMASAIYFISDAHGHGLANADLLAIYSLMGLSVVCCLMMLVLIKRRY